MQSISTYKHSSEILETFVVRCEVALANIEDLIESKNYTHLVLNEAKKIDQMAINLELDDIANLSKKLAKLSNSNEKKRLISAFTELSREIESLASTHKV